MDKAAYIKLWLDYRDYFETLSDAEVGRLVRAMLDYELDGATPKFSGSERVLWPVMRRNIDIDHEFIEKQSKNGSKGGRPKKPKETQQNPEKPKETQQNQKQKIENRKQKIEDISCVSNDTQDICQAESLATRKRAPAYSAKKAIEEYTQDAELRELLFEWLDNRKKQRAPETKGAIGQNLDKLAGMAAQSSMSLQDYMREVVRKGWQAFYPIRDAQQAAPQRRTDGRDFDWLTGQ